MNINVSNSGGSSFIGGFSLEQNMQFNSGFDMARQRRVVFIGHDLAPRYADFLQGGGVPDREDQTWNQKKPQGRNFSRASMLTGRQGMISGNLEPYYELMTEMCYNVCGKPFLVQKVADDDYVLDNAGTRRMRQFRYPTTGAPKIWLWDVYIGSKTQSTHYLKTKTRQFSMDVARNGEAGTLSGTIEMHANEIEDGLVPMPFYTATNQVTSLVQSGATGGTFKITVTDPATGTTAQTAGIAYNANAAAVQSALEALANVGVGDLVCSGGAMGAAPVIATAAATFAHLPFPPLEVDGTSLVGANALVTATTTTAGSDGLGPRDVAQTPIEVDHVKVYKGTDQDDMDTIDMTDPDDPHLLTDLLGHNFSMGDLWNPVFTENQSRFPSNFVGGAMTGALALVLPEGVDGTTIHQTEDGCIADTFRLRFVFQCGEFGNEYWIEAKVMRSAGWDPNDSNDIFQKSWPLVLADDDDDNTLIFTTIEPIS